MNIGQRTLGGDRTACHPLHGAWAQWVMTHPPTYYLPPISRAVCESPSWEPSRDTPPSGRASSVTTHHRGGGEKKGAISFLLALTISFLEFPHALSLPVSPTPSFAQDHCSPSLVKDSCSPTPPPHRFLFLGISQLRENFLAKDGRSPEPWQAGWRPMGWVGPLLPCILGLLLPP